MKITEKILYISAPFGFGRQAAPKEEREAYMKRLLREAEALPERLQGAKLSCVRVGGAATRLPPEPLAEMLSGIRRSCGAEDMELTLTALPGDFTSPLLSALAASGYTRMELEALSLSARVLRSMGTPHTVEDVEDALELLMDFRCPALSAKLLYGVPEQNWGQLRDALLTCTALPAMGHVRLLPWSRFCPEQRDENLERELAGLSRDWLEAHSFGRYADGRFARPGAEELFHTKSLAGTKCLRLFT